MWIDLSRDAPSRRSKATPQAVNSPAEADDCGGDPYPGAGAGSPVSPTNGNPGGKQPSGNATSFTPSRSSFDASRSEVQPAWEIW